MLGLYPEFQTASIVIAAGNLAAEPDSKKYQDSLYLRVCQRLNRPGEENEVDKILIAIIEKVQCQERKK